MYSGNGLLLDWSCGYLFPEGLTAFVTLSLPGTLSLKMSSCLFVMIVLESIMGSEALHHTNHCTNLSEPEIQGMDPDLYPIRII